jgi:glycosyltransferase involved in cell wall biosynthesis
MPKKPRRILIFSLAYYPRLVAGAEVAIKEITDRIPPSEIIFDMITLRFDKALPREEKIGNVHIHRIGFVKENPTAEELVRFPMYLAKVLYPIIATIRALELHKTNRYDAIWSMMSYMGFPALFFSWFHPRVKRILTLQDGDSEHHLVGRRRIKLVSFLYKKIFKKADTVQVISTYLGGFAKKMGYPGEPIVIPNGVDIQKFRQAFTPHEIDLVKKKVNKKEGDMLLITTSRLVEKNNIGAVISAMVHLPPHISFLVLGVGPLEMSLRKKAEELGLGKRVHFLGFIDNAEIPKYLRISDIFIRPSISEGMGISFIEAMAAEIPVITTPVGGIVDFVKDGETGIFCETNNPRNIAQKIEKLIKDKESRDIIVRNAKAMVDQKYDWKLIASEMKMKVLS